MMCTEKGCELSAPHTHKRGIRDAFASPPTSKLITDMRESALPTDSEVRKNLPMATGVLDYFPAALAAVAELSKVGNDKHNPGQDLHWSRGKSVDHADTIMRHLAERGTLDTDGLLHDAKVAWRALAMLQEELERRGAPMSRASRVAKSPQEAANERSEVAYLVAKQLKKEGFDLNLPETAEGVRAKELWAYYLSGVVPSSGRPDA